jgi:uncharacterized protein with ParB-like and HNH nuclease domain
MLRTLKGTNGIMSIRNVDHDLDFTRTSVRRLIADLREGRLCIPEFQRGYVWKPNKAADLEDIQGSR